MSADELENASPSVKRYPDIFSITQWSLLHAFIMSKSPTSTVWVVLRTLQFVIQSRSGEKARSGGYQSRLEPSKLVRQVSQGQSDLIN